MIAPSPGGWRGVGRAALLPAVILVLVALMVVPLPPLLLDVFFILNILVALVVLLVALGAQRPLDFSSFPTVLLFATLLRLSLNVASTRVVLVDGHTGTAAAGHVIEAFGKFLIGGDYVVGLLVFLILLIVNLVVIAKGAGRVSEVSARFTLDALPGKQMAIDADLNAGLLTSDEARRRRAEVATEADFYGAMDGASKFVKGDAVAGVIILLVNMIGGLLIGTLRHDMPFGEAAAVYFVLTVGDGLVAQVPALLLSIAAAAIVTRVSSSEDLTGQIGGQVADRVAWGAVAAILALLALLPGMPALLLLAVAAGAGAVAWRLARQPPPAEPAPAFEADADWDAPEPGAPILVELGYALIGLVDERAGAPLMARITAVRRQISADLGFQLPVARVRDDMALPPAGYRLTVGGEVAAEDEVSPGELLALADAGADAGAVQGRPVTDPAFGMPALWIAAGDRETAMAAGYAVVDPATVIATHLSSVLTREARLLLGHDEAQALLDALGREAPQLAASLTKAVPLGLLAACLRNLLDEGVPLRDVRRIGEALATVAGRSADPDELTELLRPHIGGLLVRRLGPPREPLRAVTLAPDLERLLVAAVAQGGVHGIDPLLAGRLLDAVDGLAARLAAGGTALAEHGAVVTAPPLRRPLRRLLRTRHPDLAVLSAFELPDARAVELVATIGGEG